MCALLSPECDGVTPRLLVLLLLLPHPSPAATMLLRPAHSGCYTVACEVAAQRHGHGGGGGSKTVHVSNSTRPARAVIARLLVSGASILHSAQKPEGTAPNSSRAAPARPWEVGHRRRGRSGCAPTSCRAWVRRSLLDGRALRTRLTSSPLRRYVGHRGGRLLRLQHDAAYPHQPEGHTRVRGPPVAGHSPLVARP